ncbi:hypothetical protein CTAYLR_003129 [Chrysophaeum taylorii]|uniref:RNase H type-1 domain-containing protein n=1 Tax=Chrysophaeum taylorii TaxID=2483200 RepID=A0AAD7UNF0_9STRA|nr:hypothetical protein CTAYLR_003129 [Chrysophaeum taylorii]
MWFAIVAAYARLSPRGVLSAPELEARCRDWPFVLYFDGGSRGNPGSGGCGAVVLNASGLPVVESWAFLDDPRTTNNVAEYCGLLLGAKGLDGIDRCLICGDSKLVVSQVSGDWRCNDRRLKALRARVLEALDGTEFEIIHIPRHLNARADDLANHAMDTASSGSRRV